MIPLVILAIEDDYDREFMTNLFMKYKDVMYRRAYGIVKDPELAEDALQTTIVKLIEKIDLLEKMDPNKLPAYIVSAVETNAINYYHKRKSRQKKAYYNVEDDLILNIPDGGTLPDDCIIDNETARRLMETLDRLPESEKSILIYKYISEYADVEISNMLGISKGSVRVYLSRAKKHALALMQEEGVTHVE